MSAYATMHPWEDWAETWAHYLHIVDTVDTAASCGLALTPDKPQEPTLTDQTPVEEASFESLMKRWFPLTYVLNSLNRSLGLPDGYPFTLSPVVVDKLRFVHRVISAGPQEKIAPVAEQPAPAEAAPAPAPAPEAVVEPEVENAVDGGQAMQNVDTPAQDAVPAAPPAEPTPAQESVPPAPAAAPAAAPSTQGT